MSSEIHSPPIPQLGYKFINQSIIIFIVQGCETKDAKLVRMCLALMQRLIVNKVIDFKGARYITDTLWMLMESSIEVSLIRFKEGYSISMYTGLYDPS